MRLCIPWTTSLMSSVGESCILVLCTAAVVTDDELQLLQLHVREKKMSGLNGEVGDGEVATGQQGDDCWQRVRMVLVSKQPPSGHVVGEWQEWCWVTDPWPKAGDVSGPLLV